MLWNFPKCCFTSKKCVILVKNQNWKFNTFLVHNTEEMRRLIMDLMQQKDRKRNSEVDDGGTISYAKCVVSTLKLEISLLTAISALRCMLFWIAFILRNVCLCLNIVIAIFFMILIQVVLQLTIFGQTSIVSPSHHIMSCCD